MTKHQSRIDELEQSLRDERALRIRAENRTSEQAEKTQIWRTRAEERADRIERLTAQTGQSRRRLRRSSKTIVPAPDTAALTGNARADIATPTRRTSRLASVRVATAVQTEHDLLLSAFAAEPTAGNRLGLADADLVVVDISSLALMPPDAGREFSQWLETPARQPLVVIGTDETNRDHPVLRHAAALLVASPEHPGLQQGGEVKTLALVPTFDPALHNPMVRRAGDTGAMERCERDGVSVAMIGDDVIGIESFAPEVLPAWLIEAAARGVPVSPHPLDFDDAAGVANAATSARRWAYRNHTPTVRAMQIAGLAGLRLADPMPTAAAILVSMRPDRAVDTLTMLQNQTYQPLSIVLGLHGVDRTPGLTRAIEETRRSIPTSVLSFEADLTLGECLNRAIAATGAEILVKIDDDDFYGPGHIEDGMHALEYSRASIVGKGAQFTFVEERDTTVLRRHREEEAFIGGSPTGATMLIRRSLWEPIGFPHRPRQVDVLFTNAARHNGATVYANSRWEFCYVRQASGHTWATSSTTFLAGAQQQWEGYHPERMVAPCLPDNPVGR